MTEEVKGTPRVRKSNMVVMIVKDAEGNPIMGMSKDNVEVVAVENKLTIDLYNKITSTPGAFIAMI